MKEVTKKEISAGKDPMGLAAAILYISCQKTGENITQIVIAHASGKTEVTLRNRYTDLRINSIYHKWLQDGKIKCRFGMSLDKSRGSFHDLVTE